MNELTFKKYPSIENIDRKVTIDHIAEMGLEQLPWQASLKVHGCLDGNTLITTREYGNIPISYIVNNKLNCHVMSFNHNTNELEWDEITQYHSNKNESHQQDEITQYHSNKNESHQWYEVDLEDESTLGITGNQEVWCKNKRSYIKVEDIEENDIVLSIL